MLLLGVGLSAQQPSGAPPTPDTPAITAMIEAARKAAAPEFADAVHFWCEAPRANRLDDPPIAPTKILDDVYAIGNSGTTVYVVRTTAGLLMIDALFANQVETQLLPGFRALGLDPAQVKVVLVTHGHADHFGGAAYFQEKFGSKVYVSAADWMLMENPPARVAADAVRQVRRAASETRHGHLRRAEDRAGQSHSDGYRRARTYARIDGVYISREGSTASRTWRRSSAARG